MQALRAGAAYFGLVFGAGFLLGAIRTLLIVPRTGARLAELVEMPIMLAVTILAARWVVRRFAVPGIAPLRLAVGFTGLALLVIAELTLVLRLRGLTISEDAASRDPVSGTAYLVSLGLVAVMPALVLRGAAPKA